MYIKYIYNIYIYIYIYIYKCIYIYILYIYIYGYTSDEAHPEIPAVNISQLLKVDNQCHIHENYILYQK